MKKISKSFILVALVTVFLFKSVTTVSADDCSDCLAGGNTPSECSLVCGGTNPTIPTFDDPADAINPVEPPGAETFDALNPLKIGGGDTIDESVASEHADQLSTPGGIISRLLTFIFPLAGLLLFLMISWGGFEVLMGSGDSSKVTAGKQRVTAAIVGFLVLFSSYWMIQIVEAVFGVVIF